MIKAFSLFGLTALSIVYAIGFIYDSTYIEQFGFNLNQMFGSPAEYLAIGGMLLFRGAAKFFTILFFVSGIVACAFMPAKKFFRKHKSKIDRYIDLESLPIIFASIFPLAIILYPSFIVNIAKKDANEDLKNIEKSKKVIEYQTEDSLVKSSGILLRNRNGLALIYDADTTKSLLVPTRSILVATK